MCSALIKIVNLKPVAVQATDSRINPSLPIPVKGYDLVSTEVTFENGASPITYRMAPPQYRTRNNGKQHGSSAQTECRHQSRHTGLHEIHPDGIFEVNPLFRNFEKDGVVTGYGISSPGRIYQRFLANRNGKLPEDVKREMYTPTELGFYTSLVLEGAELSLKKGTQTAPGVTKGKDIDLLQLLKEQLGEDAAKQYGY